MSLISLQNSSELEVTILSNRFIDNFMPRANGEFVKVYIYLLRAVSSSPSSFSLEHMADRLFGTERDIFRALKNWEGEKILSLTYTTDRQLSGITLLEPFADAGHMESSASSENIFSTAGTSSSPVSAQMAAGSSQPVALPVQPQKMSPSVPVILLFPAVLLQNFQPLRTTSVALHLTTSAN